MLRSICSVVGGFATWSALWLGGNTVAMTAMPGAVHQDGSINHVGLLCAILALSVICSILAGLLTGVIAKRSAMAHGVVLGVILLAVGIFVQAQYWDKMPIWYHLIFLAMLVPATLIGVKLHSARKAPGTAALAT